MKLTLEHEWTGGQRIPCWVYKASGSANVLFEYASETDSNGLWTGKVLRLRVANDPNQDIPVQDHVENARMISDALNTRECIVIPSDYCTLLPIPPLLLSALNQTRTPLRSKDGEKAQFPLLDETQRMAMVLEDVTRCSPAITFPRSRVFSIEIKPKWAFSPSLMINLPDSGDSLCRNCAYERYKNSSDSKPLPCSLRLYSSSVTVVAPCLQERLSQGKAKLFINGLRKNVNQGNLEGSVTSQEVEAAASALIQSGLMDRLSQQQALRDHELDAIYADYMAHFHSTEKNAHPPQAVNGRVADYLLCATLRDVSVFITLSDRPISKDSLQVSPSSSGNLDYWYSVRVVDLDRKSPHKIPFYWERHQKVMDFWRSESSIQHSCYASSFSGGSFSKLSSFQTSETTNVLHLLIDHFTYRHDIPQTSSQLNPVNRGAS